MVPPHNKSSSLFTPAFLGVLAVQMAFGLSYSAFLLLPKYLRVELDATATEIGWVNGTALVAAAAMAPFVGISARFVRRKVLLGWGLALEGTAAVAFALTDSLGAEVYLLRVLQGLAWVIVFNATATMVADTVPRERMAQGLGYLGVAMLGTNALAPALTEPVAAHFGWSVAFGSPAFVVFASLLVVRRLPDTTTVGPRRAGRRVASGASMACYYGSLMMGAGIGVMFTFTQPYALSLGAERVGSFFLGYTAAAVFVRVGLAGLSDRVGPGRVAVLALSGYALVVLATSQLTPGLLVTLGTALGLCHGFFYPAVTASGLAGLLPEERPVFMGWFACAFNSGYALAVLSLGPVADGYGYPVIFVAVGVAIATGVVPLVLTQWRRNPAPEIPS